MKGAVLRGGAEAVPAESIRSGIGKGSYVSTAFGGLSNLCEKAEQGHQLAWRCPYLETVLQGYKSLAA
jgi:hypothetical protein